jgi:hypothetical protein
MEGGIFLVANNSCQKSPVQGFGPPIREYVQEWDDGPYPRLQARGTGSEAFLTLMYLE